MSIGLAGTVTDPTAPLIYLIASPRKPQEETMVPGMQEGTLTANVAAVSINDWNDALTPWTAPGMRHEDPPFAGHAARTLDELVRTIAAFEDAAGLKPQARSIAGYSLGGLFSLYALLNCDEFDAAASVSGSLWYDGWVEYLRDAPVPCGRDRPAKRFVYLSVGSKEKRTFIRRVQRVEECTRESERLLREKGFVTQLVVGPGSHFQFVEERIARALVALDKRQGRFPAHTD